MRKQDVEKLLEKYFDEHDKGTLVEIMKYTNLSRDAAYNGLVCSGYLDHKVAPIGRTGPGRGIIYGKVYPVMRHSPFFEMPDENGEIFEPRQVSFVEINHDEVDSNKQQDIMNKIKKLSYELYEDESCIVISKRDLVALLLPHATDFKISKYLLMWNNFDNISNMEVK